MNSVISIIQVYLLSIHRCVFEETLSMVSLFCLYFVYFANEYKPSCCEIPVYLTFDLFYFEGFSRSKSQEQV